MYMVFSFDALNITEVNSTTDKYFVTERVRFKVISGRVHTAVKKFLKNFRKPYLSQSIRRI